MCITRCDFRFKDELWYLTSPWRLGSWQWRANNSTCRVWQRYLCWTSLFALPFNTSMNHQKKTNGVMYCVLKVNTTRLDGIKQMYLGDIVFWFYLTKAGLIFYVMSSMCIVYNVNHYASFDWNGPISEDDSSKYILVKTVIVLWLNFTQACSWCPINIKSALSHYWPGATHATNDR